MILLLGLHNLGGIREFERNERVFKTGAATDVKTWRQELAGLCRGQRGKDLTGRHVGRRVMANDIRGSVGELVKKIHPFMQDTHNHRN